jgi:hypothetical protein
MIVEENENRHSPLTPDFGVPILIVGGNIGGDCPNFRASTRSVSTKRGLSPSPGRGHSGESLERVRPRNPHRIMSYGAFDDGTKTSDTPKPNPILLRQLHAAARSAAEPGGGVDALPLVPHGLDGSA